MERQTDHERFWGVADEFIASGRVEEGTMMGHHCLRATLTGGFVATVDRSTGDLVVKLPRQRVEELVASGATVFRSPQAERPSESGSRSRPTTQMNGHS